MGHKNRHSKQVTQCTKLLVQPFPTVPCESLFSSLAPVFPAISQPPQTRWYASEKRPALMKPRNHKMRTINGLILIFTSHPSLTQVQRRGRVGRAPVSPPFEYSQHVSLPSTPCLSVCLSVRCKKGGLFLYQFLYQSFYFRPLVRCKGLKRVVQCSPFSHIRFLGTTAT